MLYISAVTDVLKSQQIIHVHGSGGGGVILDFAM